MKLSNEAFEIKCDWEGRKPSGKSIAADSIGAGAGVTGLVVRSGDISIEIPPHSMSVLANAILEAASRLFKSELLSAIDLAEASLTPEKERS